MRKVLVTGGAGYIGSHAAKAFAAAGWSVVVVDNLSRGWREAVRWGPLIEGDISDGIFMRDVLAREQPDLVVHFAAYAYVGESVERPGLYYTNNVAGSLALVEAMIACGIDKLVFSSTCATYGHPVRVPIDEDHPQVPINPYGWSKLFVERILKDFAAAHGLSSISLRYFNAAGGDPDGEIGERHEPEPHVIPLAIAAALDGAGVFTINGTDFDTPDGSAVRDFIHVADLADAHVAAAEHLLAGATGADAINLGTGTGTSVRAIADAVEAATGRPLTRVEGPRRPGDPALLVASPERARTELGWTPKRSDIATIVRTAVDWELKQRMGR